MSSDLQKDVIRNWWLKAEESLTAAKREFEAGSYIFAVNRLYYAAFYGVTAALLDRQKKFKKHSGVRIAFHQEFINTGLLAIEWSKFYDQLFEDRQEGDYQPFMAFDRKYVETQLERCSQFLSELKPLISLLK